MCILAATPARGEVREAFGVKAMLRSAGGAVYGQALRRPFEWARTAGGYGRRAGSGFAQQAAKAGIQFAVGALRHEEHRYQRAEGTGIWKRTRHALVATLIVPRKNRPGRTVAAGRLSGAFGAGLLSRLWQPARLHTFSSGFASGGISLGIDAGMNVLREFWPDLRGKRGEQDPRGADASPREAATALRGTSGRAACACCSDPPPGP